MSEREQSDTAAPAEADEPAEASVVAEDEEEDEEEEDEEEEDEEEEDEEKPKPAWRRKLEGLISKYGYAAIGTWFAIFALTWLGFVGAITLGFDVDSGGEGTGTVVAAYIGTQLAKPFRIYATVALTPIVANVWQRFFPPKPDEDEDKDEAADEDEGADEDQDEDSEEASA